MVVELGLACHLRLAMDDDHGSVVAAATEALVALVGPGPEELAALEAADCLPHTGTTGAAVCGMHCPMSL